MKFYRLVSLLSFLSNYDFHLLIMCICYISLFISNPVDRKNISNKSSPSKRVGNFLRNGGNKELNARSPDRIITWIG